jgi:hypothetical protein
MQSGRRAHTTLAPQERTSRSSTRPRALTRSTEKATLGFVDHDQCRREIEHLRQFFGRRRGKVRSGRSCGRRGRPRCRRRRRSPGIHAFRLASALLERRRPPRVQADRLGRLRVVGSFSGRAGVAARTAPRVHRDPSGGSDHPGCCQASRGRIGPLCVKARDSRDRGAVCAPLCRRVCRPRFGASFEDVLAHAKLFAPPCARVKVACRAETRGHVGPLDT